MPEKYKNKYRIQSARLQNWNYAWDGMYFITICTKNMVHYFGEIVDKEMQLSHLGILADIFWHEIKSHAKNIELDAFIVMPNHVHGILILDGNDIDNRIDNRRDVACNVSTTTPKKNEFMSSISPKRNSISTIIRSYKSAVTKHARRLGFEFEWQTRFYDHIIKNSESYTKISNYIRANPEKWSEDLYFKNRY